MAASTDLIVKLLRNIGSRKEIEQFLRQFTSVDASRFAVIRIAGAVLQHDLDDVVSSMAVLSSLGLLPVVVHGAGPQLDEALAARGIATPRLDGLRVTPPEALEVVRKVLHAENLRLVDALERAGIRARPITSGVFEVEPVDTATMGLLGRITRVDSTPIESALGNGTIPVLASLGESANGQIFNVNAVMATRALATRIQPHKVVFLSERGGLADEHGTVLSAINLVEDYAPLMASSWLRGQARLKIQEIKHILEELPHASSVSITRADQLVRELFTYRGAGTLVRMGEAIRSFDSLEGVDTTRLQHLLEACFGKQLRTDYFQTRNFFRVYLADSYRATALLTSDSAIPYLDKFAVTQEAQGIGVGRSIWQRMCRDVPRFFWRARKDNPVNPWYFENAAGSFKHDRWVVFWHGFHEFNLVRDCIDYALALPASLKDPAQV